MIAFSSLPCFVRIGHRLVMTRMLDTTALTQRVSKYRPPAKGDVVMPTSVMHFSGMPWSCSFGRMHHMTSWVLLDVLLHVKTDCTR